jgi:uncharacterized membrane protein
MKSLPFYAVLLGLSICWLGNERSYANNNVNVENSAPAISANSLLAATPAKVEEFTASGTEPFWGVTIKRSGIVYTTPDAGSRKYAYTAPMRASGRPADSVRVYRLNGSQSGLLVIKKARACSDGMSDNVYSYDATLILGNRVMEGCARKNS